MRVAGTTWQGLAAALLAACTVCSAMPLSPGQIEEIQRYAGLAREALSADELRQYAVRLGELPDARSIAALGAVLRRCEVLESGTVASVNPKSIELARAYAMNALVKLRAYDRSADTLIREHFRITPAVCIALVKSRYAPVYELMEAEIARQLRGLPDEVSVKELEPLTPMLQCAVRARPDFFRDAPDEPGEHGGRTASGSGTPRTPDDDDEEHRVTTQRGIIDTMISAAVILDHTRAPRALKPLELLLQHRYAFVWDKPVYRAIYNVRLPAGQRAMALRRALRAARNRDRDTCRWDWNQPSSIVFSIDDIASEAMLVLTLWRLPGSIAAKTAEVQPSLQSSSFTARAAAIDCLASDAAASKALAPVLQARDVNTRRFLAYRLAMETNATARAILRRVARDPDPSVASVAQHN